MGYELLIIDDLGAEQSGEYAMENVFGVIDHRCCRRAEIAKDKVQEVKILLNV